VGEEQDRIYRILDNLQQQNTNILTAIGKLEKSEDTYKDSIKEAYAEMEKLSDKIDDLTKKFENMLGEKKAKSAFIAGFWTVAGSSIVGAIGWLILTVVEGKQDIALIKQELAITRPNLPDIKKEKK